METIVWAVHVIVAVVLVVLVLMQQGKGADMGAAFGGGSSGSLFGASGSGNFMSRTTAFMAAVFFCTSLGLTYISSNRTEDLGIMGVMGDVLDSSEALPVIDGEPGQDIIPSVIKDFSNAEQIPN